MLFNFLNINCQTPLTTLQHNTTHRKSHTILTLVLLFLPLQHFPTIHAQTPHPSTAFKKDRPILKKRLQIEWYGRSFVYLTSSSGVRIAINPFPPGTPGYQFPHGLAADVVLISDSNKVHDGAELLSGNPLIFRGPVAVGTHRASGIIFNGIATRQQKSSNPHTDHNTIFFFTLDGMKIVHLGSLGHSLTPKEISTIGRADILFVPIGNRKLSLEDIDKIIYDLDPAIVIPIEYALRPHDQKSQLRPAAPFLKYEKNIVPIEEHGFLIGPDLLPDTTTIVTLIPPPHTEPLKP